jgi:hypothetical protein
MTNDRQSIGSGKRVAGVAVLGVCGGKEALCFSRCLGSRSATPARGDRI